MYDQFYNFSAEPFRLSPDHAFAYSHKGYTKARAYMAYAFMRAEGFVMITGRPGTGKTTLIGALLDQLASKNVNTANLVCTQLKADDLLKLVAYDFGISTAVVEKGELLQRLTQQFKSWHRDGRRALLIVDEAQDLSISAMEELRLLTNIQVDSKPLLQIFLLGQPELRELILSPQLEQIHQRIIAASHLQPLESNETEAYIRHRLEVVGWRGDPAISKAVYPLVYKFSGGLPRRINLICSRLLLHCAVEQSHRVAVADMREVVQELQDENLAAGPPFTERDFQVSDVFDDDPGSGNESATVTSESNSETVEARHTPVRDQATGNADSSLIEQINQPEPPIATVLKSATEHRSENAMQIRSDENPRLKVVAGTMESSPAQGANLVGRQRAARPTYSHEVTADLMPRHDIPEEQPAQRHSERDDQSVLETRVRGLSARGSGSELALNKVESSPDSEKNTIPHTSRLITDRPGSKQADSKSAPLERDINSTWSMLLILLVSVLLVMWAVFGF